MLIFHLWPHCLCHVICAGDDVVLGVLGDGDEILARSVREEEGLKIGALGHAESGD